MRQKFFVIFLTIFFIGNLRAQPTSVLSLKTCIQRAQKFSYRLQADQQKAEAAKQVYQYERSQTRPQIAGELSGERRLLEPYNFNQHWAFVHSDWALGEFFLNTARSAKQEELIAEADKQQSRLDVSLRTAMLYINILQQQARIKLLQKRFELLDAHYNVAKALWQSGTRTQFDLLQTESETARLKEKITILELDRDNLLQELARLINEKNVQNMELQSLNSERVYKQSVPAFMSDGLQNIPMIQTIDFQIKAQQIRTLAVTAQQLPHLNIAGGYITDGDPTGDGNYWLVGAGITMPLFRWNAANFQRQESKALVLSLDFHKKEIERDLSIFISQTQQKLARLKDVIHLQQERLKTTENAFKLAEANYQAGLMTNLEYLSAQQQLTETHIAIHETQLEYVMSLVKFYIITNQLEKIEFMENLR